MRLALIRALGLEPLVERLVRALADLLCRFNRHAWGVGVDVGHTDGTFAVALICHNCGRVETITTETQGHDLYQLAVDLAEFNVSRGVHGPVEMTDEIRRHLAPYRVRHRDET